MSTNASYAPGLHIICGFQSRNQAALGEYTALRDLLYSCIRKHHLHALGEVFHQFPGAGYTGVICLTESHISIHTWPEYGRVTFEVFLSNYQHVNDEICEQICADVIRFFDAEQIESNRIKR
jgi:S-adenosylmethionine decarboxylase